MMKRTKYQQVKDDYKITREKFFDTQERGGIMVNTYVMAMKDKRRGKTTWPMRWMLVHLAMNSGLRVSEIAALKIQDIHLDVENPYIKVRQGKRGKSRDVYIDSELVEHLRIVIYEKQYTEIVTKIGEQRYVPLEGKPDAPLFYGSGSGYRYKQDDNRHYTTTALHIAFKQAIKAAGLRNDLSIHSARHSYATLLLHKTGNLRYVQKQLGHSSLNMTALYADVLPEENGRLANMILDEDETKTTKP